MGSINDMSAPAKLGLATGGTGALVGAVYWWARDPGVIWIVLGGVACVIVLLLLYWLLLKRIDWRKALRLESIIPTGANTKGLTPQEVADLASARKAFAEGVEKFRANGKSLTKVPWYVVVGESGGGKSEAIRRSNIPFIPGLTNKLQGVGGTVNMNWWFTRDAVLLDTAGKWMMEDTSGWEQFLQHLKEHRAECPINGLLLMVPAPSLISDNIPGAMGGGGPRMTLTQKAEHIASQFERMQTTLGIRFPVYVIITKCDLIEGFNEFFGDLKDGHEINQMLGWSNPAPLDEVFRPEMVDDHLRVVRERLLRRRLRLLQNPINTDDPTRVRTEQVDALYTLPESLTKIGPRLKQFLDTLFVAGTFSERPLFLRGIYFTSSMQEGAPWDLDLATAMGIPAESLPTGKMQGGERAYFLRDLFVEKLFQERGLVTRATDVDQSHRRRKVMLLGAGIAASLLLIAATVFSFYSFEKSINQARNFWAQVAGKAFDQTQWKGVHSSGDAYVLDETPSVGFVTRREALQQSVNFSEHEIRPPFMFMRGTIDLKPANVALVQMTVTRPLAQTVRERLAQNTEWDAAAVEQLAALLRMEGAASGATQPSMRVTAETFDSLFQYALKADTARQKYELDKPHVRDVLKWSLENPAEFNGIDYWTGAGTKEAHENLPQAIRKYTTFAKAQGAQSKALDQFAELVRSLEAFERAQTRLAETGAPPETTEQYDVQYARWNSELTALRQAAQQIQEQHAQAVGGSGDAVAAFESQLKRDFQSHLEGLDKLLEATNSGNSAFLVTSRQELSTAKAGIEKALGTRSTALKEALSNFQGRYLTASPAPGKAKFQWQLEWCERIDRSVKRTEDSTLAGMDWMARGQHAAQRMAELEKLRKDMPGPPAVAAAGAAQPPSNEPWTRLLETINSFVLPHMAERLIRYEQASTVEQWPADAGGWSREIARLANDPNRARHDTKWDRPAVLSKEVEPYDASYHPPIVTLVGTEKQRLSKLVKDEQLSFLNQMDVRSQFLDRERALEEYLGQYRTYWTETVVEPLKFEPRNWNDFNESINSPRARFTTIHSALTKLADQMRDAAAAIDDQALVKRVETAKADLENTKKECSLMLGNWKELSLESVPRARERLLRMSLTEFQEHYQTSLEEQVDELFLVFWADLPWYAMASLAADSDRTCGEQMRELEGLKRFPLGLPRQGEAELTPKEVDRARELLAALTAGARTAAGAGADEKTLARQRLRNPKLERELNRLRGSSQLIAELPRLNFMYRIADALPRNGKPVGWRIVADKSGQDSSGTWEQVWISQGGKKLSSRPVTLRNFPESETLEVGALPGGALKFEFGNFGNDPKPMATKIVGDEKTPSGWAPLRLLLDSDVQVQRYPDPQYDRVWVCKMRHAAPNNTGTGWVSFQLQFGGEGGEGKFPDPKEWREKLR